MGRLVDGTSGWVVEVWAQAWVLGRRYVGHAFGPYRAVAVVFFVVQGPARDLVFGCRVRVCGISLGG